MLRSLGKGGLLRRVPLTMQNNAAETEAVWRAFFKPLRAFVLQRVHEAQDTDDILQEVFVRIHRGLGSLRQKDNLPAWLFQITRNAVADHYRSRRERGNRRTPISMRPTRLASTGMSKPISANFLHALRP